jgi:hypothetical protein
VAEYIFRFSLRIADLDGLSTVPLILHYLERPLFIISLGSMACRDLREEKGDGRDISTTLSLNSIPRTLGVYRFTTTLLLNLMFTVSSL